MIKIPNYPLIAWTISLFFLAVIFFYGLQNMYFHQDGVDMLIDIATNWPGSLIKTHAEHLIVGHRILLRLQWLLFRIDYTGYLFVSLAIHFINLFLIFLITRKLTNSNFLASIAIILSSINTNWNETVLWMAGQPISLYALFTLLSILLILIVKKRPRIKIKPIWYLVLLITSILPGLNHGIGLTWPAIPFAVYGWEKRNNRIAITKLGKILVLAQLSLLLIFLIFAGSKVASSYNIISWFDNPIRIPLFAIIAIGNTIIGRLIWPYEDYLVRIPLVFFVAILGLILFRRINWKKIFATKEFVFIVLIVIGTYLTITLPRWQFGLAQTKAERYAYLPTMVTIIGLSMIIREIKLTSRTKLLLFVTTIILVIHQYFGFVARADPWVRRPRQTKRQRSCFYY